MKNNIFDNYKNNTLTPITCDYTTELQFKAACKTAGAYELHRFFQLSPYRTLRDNLESNCLKPQLFLQISQELQLEEKLDKYPCELNSLDMERAALAKAVLSGAELLVCFNTTEGLTPGETLSYYGDLHAISTKYSIKSVLLRTKIFPLARPVSTLRTPSAAAVDIATCPPDAAKPSLAC